MTLMAGFDWDGLVAIDRMMAQILVGTYYALASVVTMNLYIALLSDTFARVYAQAQVMTSYSNITGGSPSLLPQQGPGDDKL